MDVTGPNWCSEPYQTMGYQPTAGPMKGKGWTPKGSYPRAGQGRTPLAPLQRQETVAITPRYAPYQRKSVSKQQSRQDTTAPRHQSNQQQSYNQGRRMVKVGDGLVQTSLNAHKLALSDFKTLSLSQYNGHAYIHIWDNPKGQHVSLNYDELQQLLTHQNELTSTMEVMKLGDALHGDSDVDMSDIPEGTHC